jgi:hypothetical protein
MSLKDFELRDKTKVFNEIRTKHGQGPYKASFGKLKEGDLRDLSAPSQAELDQLHETVLKKYPPPEKPRERSGGVSGQRPDVSGPQPATDLKYTIEFENDQEKNKLVEALKSQYGECSVDVFAAEEVGAVAVKMSRPIGRIERDD